MHNRYVMMTLQEAVQEVLAILFGIDLTYEPEKDRFYAITRQLNRALRKVATEVEWSYYSSTESIGHTSPGMQDVHLRPSIRPRIIGDDAVRLVDRRGETRIWAYMLPRESIHKYGSRKGLWASITNNVLSFSRPLTRFESGLDIQVPVMREPRMFELPKRPTDPAAPVQSVPSEILRQPVDFAYPDLIILLAASYDAETNPLTQPRVQSLREEYRDLMYQLKERDERNTDAPYLNEFFVPITSNLYDAGAPSFRLHGHPHSDERQF